ncbi:hypothetical protein M8C21_018780 [Ambrosia artemisiifolia]|uniref:Uncharacterized protein n=1 Tax=Ambrosia artemisiifolia TaxID=4212 RepID=A0AAD5GEH0_AMBAR|nr:hypothetical protein M8C21_018780 [Ambrosia artemisiifolia]
MQLQRRASNDHVPLLVLPFQTQLNKEGPTPHQIKYYDCSFERSTPCAVETAVEDWWKEVEVKKRIILFIAKEGGEEPWMAMENNKQPFDAGNYDLFYNTHQTGMLRMLEAPGQIFIREGLDSSLQRKRRLVWIGPPWIGGYIDNLA